MRLFRRYGLAALFSVTRLLDEQVAQLKAELAAARVEIDDLHDRFLLKNNVPPVHTDATTLLRTALGAGAAPAAEPHLRQPGRTVGPIEAQRRAETEERDKERMRRFQPMPEMVGAPDADEEEDESAELTAPMMLTLSAAAASQPE
jgi:hypothetical protein